MVGIAVGLGAQTLVRDWLAGIFIVLENQYSRATWSASPASRAWSRTSACAARRCATWTARVHTVPNGQIIVASNVTRVRTAVTVELEVAGETDLDRAAEIVDRIGEDLEADPAWRARIIEPPRVVDVEETGAMANAEGGGHRSAPRSRLAVAEELRARIVAAFADAGIKIPFPHRLVATPATTRDGDDAGAA